MTIEIVKIRAKITIGSLVVETPYIQSFSVNVARDQVSSFSASIKVPYEKVVSNITGDGVVIAAGRGTASKIIFSGIVKKAKISPVFDDPSFVMISLEGHDILGQLNGKKYTRRCRAETATWATIDNVTRKGLRSGKFRARKSNAVTVVGADVLNDVNKVFEAPPMASSEGQARVKTPSKGNIEISQSAIIVPGVA